MAADFADPIWVRPGNAAWFVPAVSGRHPPLAVEDALQVAVLLPPSASSAGLVCSCHPVRSATMSVVEVVPSHMATELTSPEPTASVSYFWASHRFTVRRRRWCQDRGGACRWAALLSGRLRIVWGSGCLGVGRNPCRIKTSTGRRLRVSSFLLEGRRPHPFPTHPCVRGKP